MLLSISYVRSADIGKFQSVLTGDLQLGFYQPPVDPVTAGRAATDDVVHLEIEHIPFKGDAEEGTATRAISCNIVDHTLRVTR